MPDLPDISQEARLIRRLDRVADKLQEQNDMLERLLNEFKPLVRPAPPLTLVQKEDGGDA